MGKYQTLGDRRRKFWQRLVEATRRGNLPWREPDEEGTYRLESGPLVVQVNPQWAPPVLVSQRLVSEGAGRGTVGVDALSTDPNSPLNHLAVDLIGELTGAGTFEQWDALDLGLATAEAIGIDTTPEGG